MPPLHDRTPARRVAFQGELGAFSEEAVERYWPDGAIPVACQTFADVIAAISATAADYGVLPVDNASIGAIAAARAALQGAPHLAVVGETTLPVRHALLGRVGATVPALTVVASHPAALGQCRRFLQRHAVLRVQEAYDTAGAARDLAAHGRLNEAAIASVRAAERYGLTVLAADIQDLPDNWTRFAIVARRADASIGVSRW